MKKILLAAIITVSLFACKSQTETENKKEKKESKNDKPELEKKITKRDFSITPANGYNDIFLDNLAMEKFIVDTKQSDSITRRMQSFYNARNYQYAWFAAGGLTEQARGFWNLQSYYKRLKKTLL